MGNTLSGMLLVDWVTGARTFSGNSFGPPPPSKPCVCWWESEDRHHRPALATKVPLRCLELERSVEGANQKMLIQQLKELEKAGMVTRKVCPQVPQRSITPRARRASRWGLAGGNHRLGFSATRSGERGTRRHLTCDA
jgi:hypothetical protein